MTSTSRSTLTLSVSDPTVEQHATLAQDAVTALIGLWLIGGLFSDGWAHHNVPELEGFFTPWHGALYFGLLRWRLVAWLGRAGGCAGTGTCHLVTDGGSSASVFSRSED